jgi:hypothetical protein
MSMMREEDEIVVPVRKGPCEALLCAEDAEENDPDEPVFSPPLNDETYIAVVDGSSRLPLEAKEAH